MAEWDAISVSQNTLSSSQTCASCTYTSRLQIHDDHKDEDATDIDSTPWYCLPCETLRHGRSSVSSEWETDPEEDGGLRTFFTQRATGLFCDGIEYVFGALVQRSS
jgi:hypothetical protein